MTLRKFRSHKSSIFSHNHISPAAETLYRIQKAPNYDFRHQIARKKGNHHYHRARTGKDFTGGQGHARVRAYIGTFTFVDLLLKFGCLPTG